MDGARRDALDSALVTSGMTPESLWLDYAALGGDLDLPALEAYFLGGFDIDDLQYDMLAQALNEWFMAVGDGRRVPYSEVIR